jgi:hypothetical protein
MKRLRQLAILLGLPAIGAAAAAGILLGAPGLAGARPAPSAGNQNDAPPLRAPAPPRKYPRIAAAPENPFRPPVTAFAITPPPADPLPPTEPAAPAAATAAPSGRSAQPAARSSDHAESPLAGPRAATEGSIHSDNASGSDREPRAASREPLPPDGRPIARLKGVIRGEPNVALLLLDQQIHYAREGDRVGPWKILSVKETGVTLTDGARRQDLRLEGASPS